MPISGEGSPVGAVVLLDANVLYPIAVCDFLLTASSLQLLSRPIVTREIMEEAVRNLVKDRPDLGAQRIERRFDAVRAATDGYQTGPRRRFMGDQLINEKDRHVVAAALRHQVDFLVTSDARLRAEVEQLRRLRGGAALSVRPIVPGSQHSSAHLTTHRSVRLRS